MCLNTSLFVCKKQSETCLHPEAKSELSVVFGRTTGQVRGGFQTCCT